VDVHVLKHPRSPISEAFRSLRTNLEFTNVDQSLKKILVTSSGPGEGKSTIASNLAAIIAQGGKRVLLIDADMRRPRVHEIFKITNHVGLSNLFRGTMPLNLVMREIPGAQNLLIISSGSLPPNPTELLASSKMDQILLEASREVDVIIIDSPPSLVADYQVLSTKMDGVLLVVQPGTTRADSASTMLSQLGRVKAVALGVVLNKISRNNRYYGGHQYYSAYSKTEDYYSLEDKGQSQKQVEYPVRLLPKAESNRLNSDAAVVNVNEIPVELLLSKEEQSILTNSIPVTQPVASPTEAEKRQIPVAKVHKDVLEEMYNAMKKK
jgi:capsular exopolysaccharide synthesis family protein